MKNFLLFLLLALLSSCQADKLAVTDPQSTSTSNTPGFTYQSGTIDIKNHFQYPNTFSLAPTTLTGNGADITNCAASPNLPAGVSIDPLTCVISGQIRRISGNDFSNIVATPINGIYTITATNSLGLSTDASVTISSAYTGASCPAGQKRIIFYKLQDQSTGTFCNPPDSFILDVAEASGFDWPYSSRAGASSTETVFLLQGSVDNRDQSFLSDAKRLSGFFLSDTAYPTSEVVVVVVGVEEWL